MSNAKESSDNFWARYKEAERITTALKGPCPPPPMPNDAILGGLAGGFPAMLALGFAGVHGDRFEYITLAVAGISGGSVYLVKYLAYRGWHRELEHQLRQTTPRDAEYLP